MNLLNVLGGVWLKVSAVFALIIGVLVLNSKRQSAKIDTLEHENKISAKKYEIKSESSTAKAQSLSDEQDEILEMIKGINVDEKPSLNDINSL